MEALNERTVIGEAVLKEQPSIYFGNPDLTVGKSYQIIDKEGSNLWIIANDGKTTSIGSCRFETIKFF